MNALLNCIVSYHFRCLLLPPTLQLCVCVCVYLFVSALYSQLDSLILPSLFLELIKSQKLVHFLCSWTTRQLKSHAVDSLWMDENGAQHARSSGVFKVSDTKQDLCPLLLLLEIASLVAPSRAPNKWWSGSAELEIKACLVLLGLCSFCYGHL